MRTVAGRALVFLLIVILPCLNAFTPPESFLHISDFTINLYGKYLCYAILAISVDLLWGYTGLAEPGPGALLQSRRLHDGHVSHAHDRRPRPIS